MHKASDVRPGTVKMLNSKASVLRHPRTWDELAEEDSRPLPEFLKQKSGQYLGSEPLAAGRYVSPEFFRLEVEKMWPYVWQYAAREEEMPAPGDMVVFENVGRSYIIVRQDDGSVRAMHNVCLHRGRKLRTEDGWAGDLQCPYHGFTWNTDGSLKNIPCAWDFGHLSAENMHLPEAQVGRWGGYIFIKEMPGGPSLEEYLDPLPSHFARWHPELRTTTIWVAKILRANWKVVMEAFMEAWHSTVTHPQIMPFTGDSTGQCNTFGENVNFGIAPMTPSPNFDMTGKDEQWLADYHATFSRARLNPEERIVVGPGETARRAVAARARRDYALQFGHNLDHATDCEMLDSLFYSVFPNFGPWGGFKPTIDYRFRPWPDQDRTLMEIRILSLVPPGQPIPRAVPMHLLGADEPWTAAPTLPRKLAEVLDQDVGNAVQVHAGLKVSKTGQVNLANYMDIRIRHFHKTLDKYIAQPR